MSIVWAHISRTYPGKSKTLTGDKPMSLDQARLMQQHFEENKQLRAILERCRTVLGNMAAENEGAIFNRWQIGHEPLRADAKGLLPIIDAVLTAGERAS